MSAPDTNPKIAVLYHGLVRGGYEKNFASFKENFVEPNDAYEFDLFISFWDKHHTRVTNSSPSLLEVDSTEILSCFEGQGPSAVPWSMLDYCKMRNLFKSEEFEVVRNAFRCRPGYGSEFIINSILMQSYGMKMAFKALQPSLGGYRALFKNRYDFHYPIKSLLPMGGVGPGGFPSSEDQVSVLSHAPGISSHGFVDNVCAGSPKSMEILMNSYDNLLDESFLKEYGAHIDSPERFFYYSLKSKGIKTCNDLSWPGVWKKIW